MRKVGIALFVVGIVTAITAGAKMPEAGAKFSSVLGVFIAAAIAAIVGNIIWHSQEKKLVKQMLEEHKDSDEFNPLRLLEKTVHAISELKSNFDNLEDMKVCDEIDRIGEELIHPFTDKRKTVMDIMGMEKGADVLLKVAFAERYLNRVWSACSDHHRGEAKKCLDLSLSTYEKANSVV